MSSRCSINGMAEKFRHLINKPNILELPGCYDVLSAILLEQAGFNAVFLSGYGIAASFLGNPDIGITTLNETTECARNTVSKINVPLVVDVDNAYGNEDSAMRTMYELEHAGAAALIMEDQSLPKRCGHAENKSIVPLNQYLKKLDVMLKSRTTPISIIARTDAATIDEGIVRAKAFHKAGADITLIDGIRSLDDLKRFAGEVPGHKQVNLITGGKTPIVPAKVLEKLGFEVVLYSTPALYIATLAISHWTKILRESHDLNSISEHSVTFPEFQKFIEDRYNQICNSRLKNKDD